MGHTMSLMNFEECLYDVCRFEVDQYPVKERVFQRWLNSLNHEQLIEAFKKSNGRINKNKYVKRKKHLKKFRCFFVYLCQ